MSDQSFVSQDTWKNLRSLDIGSGSGIHSLAFYLLGARTIYAFDFDEYSVEGTKILWEKQGKPKNWFVSHGSILDREYLQSFSQYFDIVYAWGGLHHTGAMWEALDNSLNLVKPGGKLMISLYAKGPRYPRDLDLKQKYNSASNLGKQWMIYKKIGKIMLSRLKNLKNPFTWNEKRDRGMNVYNDIIDWLGGLPYEVASEDEVVKFCKRKEFILGRIKVKGEGGCNIYVFSFPINTAKA